MATTDHLPFLSPALTTARRWRTSTLLWIFGVLMLGEAATLVVYKLVRGQQERLWQTEFTRQVDDATSQLDYSIQQHLTLIVSLQGFFQASEHVSRRAFNTFFRSINVEKNFPDTLALSWNSVVDAQHTATFERSVQQDRSLDPSGYPGFSVHPKSAIYPRYVVTYIEPLSGNENAFGFDIGSNPVRRLTVEQARDRNQVLATAPITLAQDVGTQKGILILQPIYNTLAPVDIASRRAEFKGVVVAVLRIEDLIAASSNLDFASVRVFDITDAAATSPSDPIYAKGEYARQADVSTLTRIINVAERRWQLEFTQLHSTGRADTSFTGWAVLSLGGLATLISALLVGYLVTSRQHIGQRVAALTADLQVANEELNQANRQLGEFAHIASHELQTPVRGLLLSVDRLEEILHDHDDPDTGKFLDKLGSSAARMQKLIQELLYFARVGESQTGAIAVDLNEVMSSVRESTQWAAREPNAGWHIDPLPVIYADRDAIERVFVNLISNAIKYAKPTEPPSIKVTAEKTAHRWLIRVRDNGQGIEPRYHQTIFKPFKRLHRYEEIEGTGLGLAICKQILEQYGSTISVESSSDAGTTFLLELPQMPQQMP